MPGACEVQVEGLFLLIKELLQDSPDAPSAEAVSAGPETLGALCSHRIGSSLLGRATSSRPFSCRPALLSTSDMSSLRPCL